MTCAAQMIAILRIYRRLTVLEKKKCGTNLYAYLSSSDYIKNLVKINNVILLFARCARLYFVYISGFLIFKTSFLKNNYRIQRRKREKVYRNFLTFDVQVQDR